jgi:hypothetical protein
MTISYIAAGTLASAADTVTPAYPAGATSGRLAVLQVVSAHPNASIPSTPSGWTLAGTFSGGGGVFAAGTGPRRLTWFMRELVGSDAAPTTAIPSGSTGSGIGAQIIVLSRSAGTGWRWDVAFGEDTTSGTGFSAAATSALTLKTGDFAVLGYAVASSTASVGTETAAATGITFGTVTHQISNAIASGYTSRLAVATGAVTAGTGTQTPTVGATLTAASTGAAGLLRIREASASIAATAQSVFPPRNLVSVTGMTGDDIVTATVYRQVSGSLTAVRAASNVDVTGVNALLRVDAEQPFGVSLNYAAVLTDVAGVQWTVYSGAITSTVTSDVVSDAIRGTGAAVKIEAPLEKKRDREAVQFNVSGRIIVQGRPRSAPALNFQLRTETDEDGDNLNEVFDSATEGVFLIRKQTSLTRLDGHYALLSDNEAPTWYDEYRWFTLDSVKADAWPDSMEAAGFTLQDIADNFSTLQDIRSAFPGTLLDIALYDFGP